MATMQARLGKRSRVYKIGDAGPRAWNFNVKQVKKASHNDNEALGWGGWGEGGNRDNEHLQVHYIPLWLILQ